MGKEKKERREQNESRLVYFFMMDTIVILSVGEKVI